MMSTPDTDQAAGQAAAGDALLSVVMPIYNEETCLKEVLGELLPYCQERNYTLILVDDDKILDTPMDYASVRTVGGDLGSASVIVIDDTVSIDWVINKTIHFFKHESCGKCTPCREGNYWMLHLTEKIHSGKASQADVDLLVNVAKQMQGKCLCPLGEFSTMAVTTAIERFPADFKPSRAGGKHG